MKRMLGICALIASLLLGTIPAASAEQWTYGDFVCEEREDGTLEIVEYLGNDESVTVPAELGGKAVTAIGASAFFCHFELTKVSFEPGIREIGNYAFQNCSALTKVSLPDTIISIGTEAFSPCYSLSRCEIPDSVEELGGGVFQARFTEVVVSENHPALRIVDGILFSRDMTRLMHAQPEFVGVEEYVVPESVEVIDRGAFAGCSSLKRVVLPQGLREIRCDAFSSCSSLQEVILPENLETVELFAFQGCPIRAAVFLSGETETYGSFNTGDVEKVYGFPGSTAAQLAANLKAEFVPFLEGTIWKSVRSADEMRFGAGGKVSMPAGGSYNVGEYWLDENAVTVGFYLSDGYRSMTGTIEGNIMYFNDLGYTFECVSSVGFELDEQTQNEAPDDSQTDANYTVWRGSIPLTKENVVGEWEGDLIFYEDGTAQRVGQYSGRYEIKEDAIWLHYYDDLYEEDVTDIYYWREDGTITDQYHDYTRK